MKKSMKKLCLIALVLCTAILTTSCDSTTCTQEISNYKFAVDEEAKIIDTETDDVIALLTIESCKLVSDEPFVVQTESDYEENQYDEVEYSALYEVKFDFKNKDDSIEFVPDHFASGEIYFSINPTNKKPDKNAFFLGLKKGNGGETSATVEFRYNQSQDEPTALFEIELDKIVEDSPKRGKVIKKDEERPFSEDEPFVYKVLEVVFAVFGTLITLAVLSLPILLIISVVRLIFGTQKKKKEINQLNERISYLEYCLTAPRCRKCNAPLTPDGRFCGKCGTLNEIVSEEEPIDAIVVETSDASSEEDEKKPDSEEEEEK